MLTSPLTATVNAITITPELSRHVTAKKGGAKLRLRLRRNRDVVGYLDTGFYVMPDDFDTVTKQVLHPKRNEQLISLFARAVAMVKASPPGTNYKVAWERALLEYRRERQRLRKEAEAEAKKAKEEEVQRRVDGWSKGLDYSYLVKKRIKLEKQLVEMDAEIEAMRVEMGLPHWNSGNTQQTLRADIKLYQETMTAFLAEKEVTLNARAFQMWKSWKTVLDEYATANKVALSLLHFDLVFYQGYKRHVMVIRGNLLNTFGAHVKKLKSFFKFAEHLGHQLHPDTKHNAFKINEEEKDVVYLDDEELDMLWEYRLVRPTVMKSIHLTLFQSLTGLRISDAAKQHAISKLKVDGEVREYLTGKCQKNGGTYKVPLSLDPRIKEILFDNSFNMNIISQAVYNRDIKGVLTDMYHHYHKHVPVVVVQREDTDGMLRSTEHPKPDLIATHSNRRSFVSRHLNSKEFNHNDVLAMIGSKDITELQKYIAIDSGSLHQKATDNARARTMQAIKTKSKKA